ncbi:DUF2470 domain-containing protein [uncultured Jatrophihabitans sp.]|uniref:DUF2470 domain-containing protein n=1 Tax=uncultured Jatrophihabitans sp. TaxID=1610747 RepID=UPI0035CAFD03
MAVTSSLGDHALARHARQALTSASAATLYVGASAGGRSSAGDSCPGSGSVADVVLYEDSGLPRLLCEPTSSVARAAGESRQAALGVRCCQRPGCPRTVMFAGALVVVGCEDVDGEPVRVVGLELRRVAILRAGVAPLVVPLATYLESADGDGLLDVAAALVEHANSQHAASLRAAAARLAGASPAAVAAARLEHLDAAGLEIGWVTLAGAHRAHVKFDRPATDPQSLAAQLRTTLTGQRGADAR